MSDSHRKRRETRSIRIELATPEDAGALAVVAALAFYDDRKWQPAWLREQNLAQDDPDKGPAHTSYEWTRRVLESLCAGRLKDTGAALYKVILGEDRIVGGLFIVPRPDLGEGDWRCEGIYVDPDYQDRGIGKEVLRLMYRSHPSVVRWTLGTPEWAVKNHSFYERMGFSRVSITEEPEVPFKSYEYENALPQDERVTL